LWPTDEDLDRAGSEALKLGPQLVAQRDALLDVACHRIGRMVWQAKFFALGEVDGDGAHSHRSPTVAVGARRKNPG
jgi:hypothetical protein